MRVQSVFGNALAALQLFDTLTNLRVDRFPLQVQPAVLFLLGFQQAAEDFLETGGAGGVQLFAEPGFEGGVADLDIHLADLLQQTSVVLV